MKQINFLVVFIFCLALVLFAIENPQLATIQIVPGFTVNAPIAVELFLAFGLGAVFAWVFSIWTRFVRMLISLQQNRQKDRQIKNLESQVQKYEAEVKTLKLALPPVDNSLGEEQSSL